MGRTLYPKVLLLCIAFSTILATTGNLRCQVSTNSGFNLSGTVLETTNVTSYTYARVDTGSEMIWVAGPYADLKVGDKISFTKGLPMRNFESKALSRTFEGVYFVPEINGPVHNRRRWRYRPYVPNQEVGAEFVARRLAPGTSWYVDFSKIKKPNSGHTIQELHEQKEKLDNHGVTFRGKVLFNTELTSKNVLHVQDGTGEFGANFVPVITDVMANIGDTVLVKGTLALDKDFGGGFKYPIVVENAQVIVESSR